MSRLLNKSWPWLLTLAFGVAVLLFWWRAYPAALSYQEQFQLFLFDGDYLCSRLAEPGGAARYVAEFLVQFYNNVLTGAAVIALLLMVMQRLTWRTMLSPNLGGLNYPLSFLPAILIWYMMGDESLLLAFPVALMMVQGLMLLYRWLAGKGRAWRFGALAVMIPAGYWLCGPVVLALAVYAGLAATEGRVAAKPQHTERAAVTTTATEGLATRAAVTAGAVLWALACVLASSLWLPYTVSQLFCGLGYYRFFEVALLTMAVAAALVAGLPLMAAAMPQPTGQAKEKGAKEKGKAGGAWAKHPWRLTAVTTAAVAVLAAVAVPSNYDARTYELIDYDYLVRTSRWDDVVAKAERRTPDLPMSVCATNLALAMKGELDNRAFDFYQRGSEGLLPNFERNYTTTLTTGEAFFRLGLVNTAQRFAFESMEAIPNYNKSVRCVKRLAETNIINGDYDVARKYLKMLKKTMFYSRWAERNEALLGNEKAIDAHPLYGYLRRMRIKDDFLFSDRELDKTCGQLVMANRENRVAQQYLLLFPVLDKDMGRFMDYLGFVTAETPSYTSLVAQQMVLMAYASRGQQVPPGVVPPQMIQQFQQFMQAYRNGGSLDLWRTTAWYYFMKGK